ncbi:MAG: hypothetical protein HZB25_05450 [Candidatus Eisenbacteria bacterium]|nr:hypothetical protein [Candidatus Eisenbacteria bacterium]
MTHTTLEHEVPPAPAAVSFYPASMRATATHLAAFLDEQRSATDAAHGHAWLWDEVLGDLVALREVTSGVTPVDGPGDWAQRWIRRAWSERRALVFQESPLVPEGGVPQRSRAMLALPVGDEGILYLEDAWLPADVRAPGREGLARVARQWADSVAASRAELARVLRQRIQDHVGPAVFDILPEDGACDPWPSTAARLAELLEADAVVFHFPDGGAVAAAPSLPDARLEPLVEMLAGMPADALRALPRLAARARTPEGHALREMGLTSLLGWARGDGLERVAVGAVRAVESGRDEFHPEHLVALKKLLALASALSRPA